MNSKNLFFVFSFIVLFIFPDCLVAQKYWVMFNNKTGTPYSVSTPSAFLSPKSIARRTMQSITVKPTDLPVTPSYVSQVDAVSGVTVLYRSKWLNGVVISVTNTVALTTINSFTFVNSSSKVNRYKVTFPFAENNPNQNTYSNKTNSPAANNYGRSLGQAAMIGADCLHYSGFRGEGMTIAVLDAGFLDAHIDPVFDSLFIQKRIKGCRDFITGDTLVFEDNYHGACVLSAMAALSYGPSVADTMIGTAPKANYWLLRTEEVAFETISEEYNWIRGAEFADSVGADLCTTSLGYTTFDGGLNDHNYATLNGKTAPMSIASTIAARTGMIVLNAAGNEGGGSWYYIGVPSDADSIITVGSVGLTGSKSGFSSHGPTADGRIKPDLCAQGGPSFVCNTGCFWGNGTSFATPVLAGAVACLWQYKKFATNMQIINALKATADSAANPNNRIGWGIPKMCAAAASTLLAVPETKDKDASVKIFPNPFNNSINIVLTDVSVQKLQVNITNVLGQIVYSETITNPGNQIQLNGVGDFSKGIYFVSLSSAQYNFTKKLVKQ